MVTHASLGVKSAFAGLKFDFDGLNEFNHPLLVPLKSGFLSHSKW